jgi:hypothetical protein
VKNLNTAVRYRHEKAVEERREHDQNVGLSVGLGFGITALAAIGLSLLLKKK